MQPASSTFRGRGGKGQGEVRTPYEAKNTLQSRAYARFVDLISEGPIEGFCNAQGITVQDAQLLEQPAVNGSHQLWYDPTKFDVEFESGSSGAFSVYGRVSSDILMNDALFTPSAGYPFCSVGDLTLKVSITATFRESIGTANELSDSTVKDNAEVYLLTYPRNSAEQARTLKTIVQNGHGFSVGDVVYRKRTAVNAYVWSLLPDGFSPFIFQTRVIRSSALNTFTAEVYPICEEGRALGLYFKTQGSNYLTTTQIENPVTQTNHGFIIGTTIDYVGSAWVRASRYTQTTATVTAVHSANSFSARRQVYDAPKLNMPSVVATAVFFDDTPLADPVTLQYNFANVRLDYRLGDEVQVPLVGFEQTETLLEASQSATITNRVSQPGVVPVIISLPPGDWDELLINLLLPDGLYRQDMTNGDIFGLGDNYGIRGAPSSSAAIPANQPPVVRITYRLVETTEGGAEQLSEEYPFGSNDGYVVIKGKTMSPYEVTVRGSLVPSNANSTGTRVVRLYFRRMSPDDDSYTNGDVARRSRVVVNSITGIINARMSYPYCAVVGIELDAEQFTTIPVRGYQVKLIKVLVPSNYFPRFSKRVRTISGVTYTDFRTNSEYNRLSDGSSVFDEAGNPIDQIWDGTFYESWTDNPAWIVYALATDTRFGFGSHIQQANKWLFYQIGRYCDELIPTTWNGTQFTSKEPRFACSAYFQTFEDAWRVLSDLTSSFAGYVYYHTGTLIPVQDRPRTSRFSFGPANVENGFFTYTGIHKSGRYSAAVVKFSDPANHFRPTPVVEQDDELTGQLGWKPLEKVAFGCTSRFQAQRFARRLLLESKELTTTVKFTTGLLGSVLRPGDVIEVYDPSRSSLPFAGRIIGVSQDNANHPVVTLDRYITEEQLVSNDDELFETYGLVCQLPIGVPQATEIASESDLDAYMSKQITAPLRLAGISRGANGTTVLTLAEPLPVGVVVGAIWGLRRRDVQPQFFQILSVEETSKHKFGVVAVEYQAALYDAIDHDASYSEPPINPDLDAWKRPQPPRNLRFEVWPRVNDDGQKIYGVTISWSPPEKGFAKAYKVEWKRGLGDYQALTTTSLTTAETVVLEADNYCVQVRTIGITGVVSTPVELCRVIGGSNITNKEVISGLELTGLANATMFDTGDASFDWRVNWSEASSELHSGIPPVLAPSISDYEVAIYDLDLTLLFTTSRRETSFVLTLDQNKQLPNGCRREFILGVRARTRDGLLSTQTTLRVRNERPIVPTFTHESDVNGYLLLNFNPSSARDFSHFNVWLSETPDFTPSNLNLIYSGASSIVSITLTPGTQVYFRVAEVDQLAQTELDCEISPQYSVVGRRVGALTVFDFISPSWTV